MGRISRWEIAAWLAALVALTAALVLLRETLHQAHIALAYLLVVQLASARGGRTLGLILAVLAFLAFDWFLLPPYHTLRLENPLDWLVLIAFLVTSVVSAQLLYRAHGEAELARRRTAEVDRLASLGAETLNAPRAGDALTSIVDVIKTTLSADSCAVFTAGLDGVIRFPDAGRDGQFLPQTPALVERVLERGETAVERGDGTFSLSVEVPLSPSVFAAHPPIVALLLPLRARERVVAVLHLRRAAGFELNADDLRVLAALSYYAALGVERVQLTSEADRAQLLQEADRAKDAVLAAVSHDLRTPLTTIKGLAQELRDTRDERAVIIEEEADRLNRLVADLLAMSRLNSGGVALDLQPNEVEDLLGAAMQQAAGLLKDRALAVRIEPRGALLLGQLDFTQTLRALVNLIENAVKYSPPDSPIELIAHREDQTLVIDVADRGPGVPVADQTRIFEPFYRARSGGTGTGLGLFIARRLMAAQGGTVEYTAREGGGSLFSLCIPALDVARAPVKLVTDPT